MLRICHQHSQPYDLGTLRVFHSARDCKEARAAPQVSGQTMLRRLALAPRRLTTTAERSRASHHTAVQLGFCALNGRVEELDVGREITPSPPPPGLHLGEPGERAPHAGKAGGPPGGRGVGQGWACGPEWAAARDHPPLQSNGERRWLGWPFLPHRAWPSCAHLW